MATSSEFETGTYQWYQPPQPQRSLAAIYAAIMATLMLALCVAILVVAL